MRVSISKAIRSSSDLAKINTPSVTTRPRNTNGASSITRTSASILQPSRRVEPARRRESWVTVRGAGTPAITLFFETEQKQRVGNVQPLGPPVDALPPPGFRQAVPFGCHCQAAWPSSTLVRTLVSQENDARPECACFDELYVDLVVQLAKHRLPTPKNYRVDVEAVFIDQAELHEG
jgi:hypothetical protein